MARHLTTAAVTTEWWQGHVLIVCIGCCARALWRCCSGCSPQLCMSSGALLRLEVVQHVLLHKVCVWCV